MKAITKVKSTVFCDKCDWKEDTKDVSSWHNKECPKCNNCIIIDDNDMKAYYNSNALMDLINGIAGNIKDGEPTIKVAYKTGR